MRSSGLFHITVAAVALLGLGAAVAAVLGSIDWAIACGGLAVAALALVLVSLDRRTQAAAQMTRQSADRARQAAGRVSADVRRVETLVDAMQRRLVASMESARVEAATRHREASAAQSQR